MLLQEGFKKVQWQEQLREDSHSTQGQGCKKENNFFSSFICPVE